MLHKLPDLKPEIVQLESDILDLELAINKINALIGDKRNATQPND